MVCDSVGVLVVVVGGRRRGGISEEMEKKWKEGKIKSIKSKGGKRER